MFIKVTAVYFNEESKEFKMRLDNGAEYTSYDMPTGSCWVTNWKKEEDPKPRLNQDWKERFRRLPETDMTTEAFIQDLLDEQREKRSVTIQLVYNWKGQKIVYKSITLTSPDSHTTYEITTKPPADKVLSEAVAKKLLDQLKKGEDR